MIIECPNCRQRISSKQDTCPHCQLALTESADGLNIDEARRRQRRLLRSRIEMHSYAAILLTVAGATWMYFSSGQMNERPGFWPTATMAAGVVWYLVVRIYTIFVKSRG